MGLRINTNVAALSAHRSMVNNDDKLSESLTRLSTGLRINKAADDASGMAIADGLKAQGLGLSQAVRNATDAISIVQTADGALDESINIVNTIKTKAIQAATDGQTTETRKTIQNDINKLLDEMDAIAKTTSFNGQKLLSGSFTNKKIQIGASANETASISIGSAESSKTGHVSSATLNLASGDGGEVQLTITSSITNEQLTLNSIDIQYNNSSENGMGALADEVNRYSSTTGIKASAVVVSTTSTAIQAGTTGSDFAINGVTIGAISVLDNDSNNALVNGINAKNAETGVSASLTNDGKLVLTSDDGRAIKVDGSVSGVMGSTSGQMSTVGYLSLVQSGVSSFQINGIGAGATGAAFTISADMDTVKDSVLAAGSTIWAGSKLAAGSTIGGDARALVTQSGTQLDTALQAGSTLQYGSVLKAGTVLGGTVTVGGNLSTTSGLRALDQDMLVTAGSKLASGSIIGAGTVVTTQFTVGTTTYNAGDTLTSAVTLGSDLTLTADMNLKYSSTDGANSKLKIGSTLNAGTVLGDDITVGLQYTGGTTTDVATAAFTADQYTVADISMGTNAGSGVDFIAGSVLASGSTFTISTGGAWTGPTLVTTTGVITEGDTVAASTAVTLEGDQIITENFSTVDATTVSVKAGSVLLTGTKFDVVPTTSGELSAISAKDSMTISEDMALEAGSTVMAGSTLLAGSEIGSDLYTFGGDIGAASASLSTYLRSDILAGSTLEGTAATAKGTIFAEGSTIGGTLTVGGAVAAVAEVLDSDMMLKAGSVLKYVGTADLNQTMLKAGTVINQEMILNTASGGGATTEVKVSAGDVLTADLYLDGLEGAGGADITLSTDMLIKEKSQIAQGSTLAVNTENSGTVGLSDTEISTLADISVLTQEGAQLAIDISEAALKDLDSKRASLGSVQNQLTSTISNLSVTMTNVSSAESNIRDVDFAEEAQNFSKLQILAQTGAYAMSQANSSAQIVMSLLQ